MRRVNDLYDMTSSLYCKLLLAKEKERHGSITQEELTNFMKRNRLSPSYFKHIVETILRDPRTLTHRNRYVVAGTIFPTVVRGYNQGGSKTLKAYLGAVREDRLEDVLDILGVTTDSRGIDEIIESMRQQDRKVNNIFFSTQEIGKSTCRVSNKMKMVAKEKIQQDMPNKDEEIRNENK